MMRRNAIVFALIAGLLAILSGWAQAAITGPDSCKAGELTVMESDVAASWAVHPVEYQTAIYPVDGGLKCVFASPNTGTVTFFAASVEDGKPVITSHVLNNGGTGPTPTPTPIPDPTTLEGVAKAELTKISTPTKAQEQTAMVDALDSVISGIDRGTIQTPEGARATFRGLWSGNAAAVSVGSAVAWSDWLTAISDKLDQTDVSALKAGFETLKNVLKSEPKPANPVPEKSAPAPVVDKPTSGDCKGGNCPVPATTKTFRWRR